ncbi:RHS repeat domain-containing protein [Snodgrassella alvi]|uniref:Teneurin-like YD-shell domain-containing protein n=1 Tax=Snodgrassella alvi TaxID=1196083 RepID=A0A2N9Y054_9NEIS|nr:RHS repeat-associated core domain-containing protein [Snodgrassella alvi]PIT58130.1 hypothetical protein BHC49_02695 [Snodgrassella alvi]
MCVAYGWKPDSDWGTSPLWQANLSEGQNLKNASYHYLISDHLGTPQLAINSTGEQSWKINSDAFGNSELDANNQITMNLRFPGQYYDAETGLSYNYFRDYDAKTGRYIQSDPIGLAGGINTYGYVGGNPLVYSDPTGEIAPAVVAGVAAAVRVGIAGIRFCSSNFRCSAAVIGALPGGLFPARNWDYDDDKHPDERRLIVACKDKAYSTWETPPDDPCKNIRKDIEYLKIRLRMRAYDLKKHDKPRWYQSAEEFRKFQNHVNRFETMRDTLRRLIEIARDMKCEK